MMKNKYSNIWDDFFQPRVPSFDIKASLLDDVRR